jgi:hypothetical protein
LRKRTKIGESFWSQANAPTFLIVAQFQTSPFDSGQLGKRLKMIVSSFSGRNLAILMFKDQSNRREESSGGVIILSTGDCEDIASLGWMQLYRQGYSLSQAIVF